MIWQERSEGQGYLNVRFPSDRERPGFSKMHTTAMIKGEAESSHG